MHNLVRSLFTDNLFSNLIQSHQARDQLGDEVIKDLMNSQKTKAVPKDSTIDAVLENRDALKLLGDDGIQKLLMAKDQRDRSRKRSQKSKSRGRHDYRNPENEYRNIEGNKPMENYYTKLYKNQPKKNASHLYKNKPHNNSR